jgi:hypothetical protein
MSTIERLRAEHYRQEDDHVSDVPWCDGCDEDWPCGVFLLLAVAEAAEEMYEWMTWNEPHAIEKAAAHDAFVAAFNALDALDGAS